MRSLKTKAVLISFLSIPPAFGLPSFGVAEERFAGIWASSCDHLSGMTFIFHDDDRLRIVDLECKILGWEEHGNTLSSDMQCSLDGVERRERITVVRQEKTLRITLGGCEHSVRYCS